MCLEIESICFERLDLVLCVWRPTGTAAGEADGVCWGGGGSSDSDQAVFPSLPPFICIPKVKAPSELCFAQKSLAAKSN